MKIMGVKVKQLMAMAQQSQSTGTDGSCPFAKMLEQAASALGQTSANQQYKTADSGSTNGGSTNGSTTGSSTTGGSNSTTGNNSSSPSNSSSNGTASQVKTRLDQAIAEAFIAPLLAQTAVNVEQKYFLHSPAEQAYAQQMYTQLASQIGTSGKMPLAKGIAKAVLQQMGQSSLWKSETSK